MKTSRKQIGRESLINFISNGHASDVLIYVKLTWVHHVGSDKYTSTTFETFKNGSLLNGIPLDRP